MQVAELSNRIAEEAVRVTELEAAVGRAQQEIEQATKHGREVAEAPQVRGHLVGWTFQASAGLS